MPLIDGITPVVGDSFTFIRAAMVDDTFDTVLFPSVPGVAFNLVYGLNSVTLAAVPFQSALAGLGFVMRQKAIRV